MQNTNKDYDKCIIGNHLNYKIMDRKIVSKVIKELKGLPNLTMGKPLSC